MTTYIASKFKAHLNTLKEAVDGNIDLRSNQKIYRKIYKYYKEQGVCFTGHSHDDYELVLDCLYEELYQ